MWMAQCETTCRISFIGIGVQKTKMEQKPVFLQNTLSRGFDYRTRAATTGSIVLNQPTSGDISRGAFIVKSKRMWNSLPPQVKQAEIQV